MDSENPNSLEQRKSKEGFCASNKCSVLVLVLTAAVIAAMIVVTFLDHGLRAKVKDEPETELQWWQTSIIYQIYPRSFQDSDGNGVGDLKGITSRLYYFKDIKVGTIWLSPFYTSPMRDFGYDVSNYTEVDPLFGTMQDFDELVKEAHRQALKVIVDFVPNHTSNESTWFELSRKKQDKYKDYYVWSDGINNGSLPPNNWQSVFEGPAWHWDDERKQFYYHAFLDSQPDLNFRNKDVREEMINVLRFWCEKGVDGFRIDAIPHMFEIANQSINEPPGQANGFNPNLHMYTKNQPEVFDVVKEWRAVLDEYEKKDGKSRLLIAETVGIPREARLKYYEAGSVPFFFDLIPAKSTCGATAGCFLNIIRDGMNLTDGEWPNFVIGNHDNSRIASSMGQEYADAMNMLLLTLPGTPTTYYGEELGMHNGDYRGQTPKDPYARTSNDPSKSRDPERNPMQWNTSVNAGFTTGQPWLDVNADYREQNVENETASKISSLHIYMGLADIRTLPAFQSSKIELPTSVKDVLVYTRADNQDQYVVAINFGHLDVTLKLDNGYKRGLFQIATKPRTLGEVNLSSLFIRKGEGVIILMID